MTRSAYSSASEPTLRLPMPLKVPADASTLLIRRSAFESIGLSRAGVDGVLGLTDEEFRVEEDRTPKQSAFHFHIAR